jgi:hypothetical protein
MKRVEWPLEIEIPRLPPPANELKRKYRHWAAYNQLKELWRMEIQAALRHAGFRTEGPCRVKMRASITLRLPRRYDPDNAHACLKPVLDEMKKAGLIRNDSARWLDLSVEQELAGQKRPLTTIRLEPAQ